MPMLFWNFRGTRGRSPVVSDYTVFEPLSLSRTGAFCIVISVRTLFQG